jgi:hypothetical protein
MQLNIRKLDQRIEKLQEIRRIAADPEMVALLLEFIANDDERPEAVKAPPFKPQVAPATHMDDMDIINQVMNGIEAPGNSIRPGKRP